MTKTFINVTINANGGIVGLENRKEVIAMILDGTNVECLYRVFKNGKEVFSIEYAPIDAWSVDNPIVLISKRFSR